MLERWMEIAVETAHVGGRILLEHYGRVDPASIHPKRLGDWVSAADQASESAIIEHLKRAAPGHDILTEETGLITGDASSPFRWIIDPLDGTTNFLRHFPVWAVSVALEARDDLALKWGTIVAGAIHIPPLNQTYWAGSNCGAFCDGRRISIGPGRPFDECLLATGFPFRTRELIDSYTELFAKLLKLCADVRRPGAVAVDLCNVAAGTFDGFWELDLAPWDIAAGSLIIKEAGGMVSNFQGGDDFLTSGDIIAGHPKIFPQLVRLVRESFPRPRGVDKAPKPE